MKTGWRLAAGQAAAELMLFFPVLLLYWKYTLGGGSLWLFLAAGLAAYAGGYGAGRSGKLNRRILELLFGLAAAAAIAGVWSGGEAWSFGWLFPYAFLAVMRGSRLGRSSEVLPDRVYLAGLGIYLVLSPFFSRFPEWQAHQGAVNVFGLAALLIFLFVLSGRQLEEAVRSDVRRSAAGRLLLRRNRGWTLAVAGLALLAANLGALRRAADGLLLLIRSGVAWLISRFSGGEAPEAVPPPPPPRQPEFPLGEPGEPSRLAKALEVVFLYAAYAVLAALAVWLIVVAWRKLVPLILKLWERYVRSGGREAAGNEELGYRDEKTRLTREPARKSPEALPFWKRRTAADREGRDNRERVRQLYRSALQAAARKGYRHESRYTPSEAGRELEKRGIYRVEPLKELITLYESVRYGERQPDDREWEQVKEKWKQAGKGR
ncbi:DUF4129 domain-containing protein [Paenibacillus aurantius]|uniref:DUF4129 domain-containing protein n=1 Tax=Paenibacillus aurantius TaxID=2918900 RepID=A0AA96LE53_9BACL|nr:DUF4129 domain-containing protein [Paenibacillus aurantius]WNQ09977.1 DUF4129 domain-containing protein [Paenibacillus aurantius]